MESGRAAEHVHSAVGEVSDGDVLAADVASAHHHCLALLPLHREAVLVVEGGRQHRGFRRDLLLLEEINSSLASLIQEIPVLRESGSKFAAFCYLP